MLIIGITGKARHGKDSVANILATKLPRPQVMRLADPLKEFTMKVFGWSKEEMEEAKDSLLDGVSPRRALQTLGTEWGRSLSEDIWVNYLLRRIALSYYHPQVQTLPSGKNILEITETVLVPDVRFKNEGEALRRIGGIIVRVYRPDVSPVLEHASEQDAPESDYVIANTGSLSELEQEVDKVLLRIKERHTLESMDKSDIQSIDVYSQSTQA